jgi:hypothetical protein
MTSEEHSYSCSICMEDIKAKYVLIVKCKHTFHEHCLFKWIIQNPKQYKELKYYQYNIVPLRGTCPLCRTEISQIFNLKNCKLKKRINFNGINPFYWHWKYVPNKNR